MNGSAQRRVTERAVRRDAPCREDDDRIPWRDLWGHAERRGDDARDGCEGADDEQHDDGEPEELEPAALRAHRWNLAQALRMRNEGVPRSGWTCHG